MWWFLNKHDKVPAEKTGSKQATQAAEATSQSRHRLPEEHLLELTPNLTSRLHPQDVAIKIWLPQIVANTVKWLADYEGGSQSSWLRGVLVQYTYGRVAYISQQMRDKRRFEERPMFSRKAVDRTRGRWVYLVPQLGKNTVAFKLWVSAQMRDDLQVLADHAKVGLSPFVREAIIAELLGRGSLPERPEMFAPPSAAAIAWENDEDVLIAEIAEQEYDGLGTADRQWRESSTPLI